MTRRDEILRALVWRFPVDRTREERAAAAGRIVQIYRIAPLLEAEQALERVQADVADTAARRDLLGRLLAAVETLELEEAEHQARIRRDVLEFLRETSPLLTSAATAAA